MNGLRVAVVGAGAFGRNHVRAISELPGAQLVGVVDPDYEKATLLAGEYSARAFRSLDEILTLADCAIVATPTVTHEEVAGRLLNAGLDVLIEKPVAHSSAAGDRLDRLAHERGRILQVGHLERFNPAITALQQALTIPLFFEVHRLSIFTPRSLDIDVVLDLMIHDLDIVLNFTGQSPSEIRAAGISVLSPKVDIANVRLSFASGCIANLTASRVSTEKVRKLRLFQPGEYVSVDYQRQDAVRLAVRKNEPNRHFVRQNPINSLNPEQKPQVGFESQIGFEPLPVTPGEPLKLELQAFFAAVRDRTEPRVTAAQATEALRLAEQILDKIKEHADLVAETIRRRPH
jgi:predicted dehydrogenase